MKKEYLKNSYIKINNTLDKWDKDINELSDLFAGNFRALISDANSYTNKPDKSEIKGITELFDKLIAIFKEKGNGSFKNYSYYHAESAIQYIFQNPNGYLELSDLSDYLTEEAKKEIDHMEKLFDIVEVGYQETINKLNSFSNDAGLPNRIDAMQLKRKDKGLPMHLFEEMEN